MALTQHLSRALHVLHYLFPTLLLAYFTIASCISVCMLQNLSAKNSERVRKPLIWLQTLVLVLYCIEAGMLYSSTRDSNVSELWGVLNWMILTVSLFKSKRPVWHVYYGSWAVAILAETVFFGFAFPGLLPTPFDISRFTIQAIRLTALVLLPLVFFFAFRAEYADEESGPLLGKTGPSAVGRDEASDYGTISEESFNEELTDSERFQRQKNRAAKRHLREVLIASGNYFNYARRFAVFVPVVWPSGKPWLQLRLVGVLSCVLIERAIILLQPLQLGLLLDGLMVRRFSESEFPIRPLALFILFSVFKYCFPLMRSLLYRPVELNANRSIRASIYAKVMILSKDLKSTEDIVKLFHQGLSLLQKLETAIFGIWPTWIDLVAIVVYLRILFGPYMALGLFTTAIFYLWCSTYWNPRLRTCDSDQFSLERSEQKMMEEMIKRLPMTTLYNQQRHEERRFSDLLNAKMATRRKLSLIRDTAKIVQGLWLLFAFGGLYAMASMQVYYGLQTIGSFTTLVFYLMTFGNCLQRLGRIENDLTQSCLDAESLLELLLAEPSVKDGSAILKFKGGNVCFKHVSGGRRRTLQDVSFDVKPGSQIALVGGAHCVGSTILKLLSRAYDPQEGSITIDGQDISDATFESLLTHIGIVSHTMILMNETVLENVRYAKLSATDEEVMDACKAAAIHDDILTYAYGYSTKVGERGVKLSSGEKLRVAIARVILQNPKIILLDEEREFVDFESERLSRTAIQNLTRGRTTIVAARRASTLKGAQNVLVIEDGKVNSQTLGIDLVRQKGTSFQLWLVKFGILDDSDVDQETDCIKSEPTKLVRKMAERSDSSLSGKPLRPDAPEFLPKDERYRYLRSTMASGGPQPSHEHVPSSHSHSHAGTSGYEHKHAVGTKAEKGPRKQNQKKQHATTTTDEDHTSDALRSESRPTTADSQHGVPVLEAVSNQKAGLASRSRSRSRRRKLAKSESSVSASNDAQGNGASGPSPLNGAGIGPVRHGHRHVSAPITIPSYSTLQGHTQQQLSTRRQRYRSKKRTAAASGSSTLVSEPGVSDLAISDLGGSTRRDALSTFQGLYRTRRLIPTVGPIVDTVPFEESQALVNGPTTIKFAPGS